MINRKKKKKVTRYVRLKKLDDKMYKFYNLITKNL